MHRSIGEYLCHHETASPTAGLTKEDREDIKQQAALRSWLALVKIGKTMSPNLVEVFDQNAGLVMNVYVWASKDYTRKRISDFERTFHVSSQQDDTIASLRDDRNEEILETLEEKVDNESSLKSFLAGNVDGISCDEAKIVVEVMMEIQKSKEQGRGSISDRNRKRISRLRKKNRPSFGCMLVVNRIFHVRFTYRKE